jgi:cytochrome b subunit of formate dehydrogenase
MRTKRFAVWLATTTICLAGALIGGSAIAANDKAVDPHKLDNATCQTCHDGQKGKLEVPAADGEKRTLYEVKPDKYGKSVHAKMTCVACHTDIVDSKAEHKKAAGVKPPECVQCHENLWETAKKENKTAEKPRLGIVLENAAAYKKSFHARENKDEPTKVNATCNDCHNVHSFDVPPRGTAERKESHLRISDVCGEPCHTDHLEDWTASAHGREITEKHNPKSAVCTDCHTTHDIGNSSSDKFKLAVTASCGDCHKESYASYKASYHGQVNSLGFAYTAKCSNCHGSHGIEPSKDPKSKMHVKNRLKTCQTCHSGKKDLPEATAGFISFSPHGTSDNFAKYPEIWLTTKAMMALLFGVFAFFWAHSGLWWYREYKDRQQGKTTPHVMTDKLPPEFSGKQVRRFGPMWRIAHLLFALAVMTLVLTGMAAFFPDTSWAKAVMTGFGSPKLAGLVHRIAAYTMLSIFAIHLVAVSINIAKNWKGFKFFGPDSFVPNWKDLADIIGMFKWFLGKGPRPAIERWSYWEKFDYWAVFWGMAIIGGSGAILAFPHVVAAYLPGWVFNIAMVVHGEEAVLAAVFLFTVHFFNNHFRPDKLPPPDVVMFTGSQSLEEFRHEHRAQYDRLLTSGELEKYLVDAPSAPFTLGSKILGLLLIAFGLILLTLITIGFLSGH